MSEFGKGYATCLVQFANHRARLAEQIDFYARMRIKEPGLFTESGGVELWANSASDHLYELERPISGITDEDWTDAETIQHRALDIGHGFRETSRSTAEECRRLLDDTDRLLVAIGVATLTEALAWDADHGLTPERGEWSCAANIERMPA